ncbi:hypothetical protein MUN84_18830 [Hymenobacter sp. 5516J-16]|uniref:hypothetical protein n=1 Tax=Hymenobacter sp. 5516J-16 TaxID=2932253 RepID=UPI001FD44007|nr:hypothetical protein [Hymenobacter sp. 5516J-16]UOQ76566.1 hypothetical protein MUN84_18830 [Hymenobacter sp. 5516J-16]
MVSQPISSRQKLESSFDEQGCSYTLTSQEPIRAFEVDEDGVARTADYIHPDGTQFELQNEKLHVRQNRRSHVIKLIP